jgi:spoIIIJ-associated protein
MLDKNDIKKITEAVEEFFLKTTIVVSKIEASSDAVKNNKTSEEDENNIDVVSLNIVSDEPQILIGEKGQTLFEIQRLLRMVLNKKIQKIFYLNLDIIEYKKKKIEYLKTLAKDLANEVALTKKEKVLFSMPAYERRIIHAELAESPDVVTESHGNGFDRHIVIKPR